MRSLFAAKIQERKSVQSWAQAFLTVSIALFPLLDAVGSPIPGFSLGSVLILMALLASLDKTNLKSAYLDAITFSFVYVAAISLLLVVSGQECFATDGTQIVVLRLLKFVIIVVPFFSMRLYRDVDFELLYRALQALCLFSALVVVVQQFAFQVGITIPNLLSAFSRDGTYSVGNYSSVDGNTFRPAGIFFEPSHMAQACFAYITWTLFDKAREYKFPAFVAAAGVVMTGSGMGLVGTALIIFAYFFSATRRNVLMTAALVAIAIVFFALIHTEFISNVIARFTTAEGSGTGNAIAARAGVGFTFFFSLDEFNQIVGTGFGNVPTRLYFNGLEYVLTTTGYVGLTALLVGSVEFGYKLDSVGRFIILEYLLLLCIAQVYSAASILFFFTFAYASSAAHHTSVLEFRRIGGSDE